MGKLVRCQQPCMLPVLKMISLVLLTFLATAHSQTTENGTVTVVTEGPTTAETTAGDVTTPGHGSTPAATTTPMAPRMPVHKLDGSVSASDDTNSSRLTDLRHELTELLVEAFNSSNSELAPLFHGIEVESASFTVNFRLVLSNVNGSGSDVNGTVAAHVLLGSLSDTGMLGNFQVGTEGVYFYMPPVPVPTEPPFELPFWGPVVAILGVVVAFLIIVIAVACYVRVKDEKKTKLMQHEEMFDAEADAEL